MATIKDVAREAGVSVTTVSHVANRTRHVSPETAKRVTAAIEKLGYRPSPIAKALKASRTHTLGMLVTTNANPFFGEVIRGAESACFAAGYTLILGNTNDEAERLAAYRRVLEARRIDGLLVMTTNATPTVFADLAASRTLPVVAIDAADGAAACVVKDDSRSGGAVAAAFLAGRGFRDIACLSGPVHHPRAGERLLGFSEGLSAQGIDLSAARVVETDLTYQGGASGFRTLLSRGRPPEAVFCLNDAAAMGALAAAAEAGFHVPDDLSIIGYDDAPIAAYTTPALTTVRQPAFELGQSAARAMIEHLEHGSPLAPRAVPAPQLVERRSVGRPRTSA